MDDQSTRDTSVPRVSAALQCRIRDLDTYSKTAQMASFRRFTALGMAMLAADPVLKIFSLSKPRLIYPNHEPSQID